MQAMHIRKTDGEAEERAGEGRRDEGMESHFAAVRASIESVWFAVPVSLPSLNAASPAHGSVPVMRKRKAMNVLCGRICHFGK